MKVDNEVKEVNEEFSNIDVELEDEELAELLGNWAQQNLAPASLHVYNEDIKFAAGSLEIFSALGHAIFNDIVVKALEETVKELEEKDATKK